MGLEITKIIEHGRAHWIKDLVGEKVSCPECHNFSYIENPPSFCFEISKISEGYKIKCRRCGCEFWAILTKKEE